MNQRITLFKMMELVNAGGWKLSGGMQGKEGLNQPVVSAETDTEGQIILTTMTHTNQPNTIQIRGEFVEVRVNDLLGEYLPARMEIVVSVPSKETRKSPHIIKSAKVMRIAALLDHDVHKRQNRQRS